MTGAGVNATVMAPGMATGVIVLGVGDIWNQSSGEVKFSGVFHMLLTQLVAASALLTYTASPVDGATGVAVSTKPALTFDRRLASYSVLLLTYDDEEDVPFTAELDITHKVLTVTPSANLAAATKYGLIFQAASADGPSVERTVISFTTA